MLQRLSKIFRCPIMVTLPNAVNGITIWCRGLQPASKVHQTSMFDTFKAGDKKSNNSGEYIFKCMHPPPKFNMFGVNFRFARSSKLCAKYTKLDICVDNWNYRPHKCIQEHFRYRTAIGKKTGKHIQRWHVSNFRLQKSWQHPICTMSSHLTRYGNNKSPRYIIHQAGIWNAWRRGPEICPKGPI